MIHVGNYKEPYPLAVPPTPEHRRVAILVVDVASVGDQAVEAGTNALYRLTNFWRQIVAPIVDARGGIVFRETGDGFMAEFPDPVEALRCAIDVQERIHQRNTADSVEGSY